MAVSGVHQWLPRGRWWSVAAAACWILIAVRNLTDAADVLDVVLASVLLACAASLICSSLPCRVRADDEGLHIRGGWWRTRTVHWSDVADVRSKRIRWSRSQLVVVDRNGREIPTGLLPGDHEASLVEHWHARTGRESIPAA